MIVKPKKNYRDICENYQRLTDREYYVIGIEADCYRIIDNYGEPTIFDTDIFDTMIFEKSLGWVDKYDNDGSRYSYEPPLGEPGFFEDYFDGKQEVISKVIAYIEKVESVEKIKLGFKKPENKFNL